MVVRVLINMGCCLILIIMMAFIYYMMRSHLYMMVDLILHYDNCTHQIHVIIMLAMYILKAIIIYEDQMGHIF